MKLNKYQTFTVGGGALTPRKRNINIRSYRAGTETRPYDEFSQISNVYRRGRRPDAPKRNINIKLYRAGTETRPYDEVK